MNFTDISNMLSNYKSTLIQLLFAAAYLGTILYVAVQTITGGAANTTFYNTLYAIILFFPAAFYLYRRGGVLETDLQIKGISDAIKSAVYFVCFVGLIYGAIYLMGNFSFLVGWFTIIVGALIAIVALAMFHEAVKNIKIGERSDETGRDYIGWAAFLWKFVFYIPCLMIDIVRYINYQIGITPSNTLSLFVFEILLLLVYFYLPGFIAKLEVHDGTQIVNDPLYLNDRQQVASAVSVFPKLEAPYKGAKAGVTNPFEMTEVPDQSLITGTGTATDKYGKQTAVNCSDVFMKSGAGYAKIDGCNLEIYDPTYKPGVVGGEPGELDATDNTVRTYSIATWVFINPQPTAVNSYSFPTNILRIGPYNIETAAQRTQGKPMLSYFNKVDRENGKYVGTYRIFLSNRDTKYYDIVAPEQKWNLFVFNYSNKIDVFLNGDLVVSAADITPPTFTSADAFIVGEDGGLDGAIRDTIFFPHILTTQQIYNIRGGGSTAAAPIAKSGGR